MVVDGGGPRLPGLGEKGGPRRSERGDDGLEQSQSRGGAERDGRCWRGVAVVRRMTVVVGEAALQEIF